MDTIIGLFQVLFSFSPPNIIFTVLIIGLTVTDLVLNRDLKAQIISVGVLGTFVGIFIGLQDFDSHNMKNSVNAVLMGLKTAFATSILGMSSAIFLSVYQKVKAQLNSDGKGKSEDEVFAEINDKLNSLNQLNYLPRLDNSKVVEELRKLSISIKNINHDSSENQAIVKLLTEIKNNQVKYSNQVLTIVAENFDKTNESLGIAIAQLSKGATEEIVKALTDVVTNFNERLKTEFGKNFEKLDSSVTKLVEWQEKYKDHVQDMEERLELSTVSIEKAKESLTVVSKSNDSIMKVYENLEDIIKTYQTQTKQIKDNLETYQNVAPKGEELFEEMQKEFKKASESFKELSGTIVDGNRVQRESFIEMNKKLIDLVQESGQTIAGEFSQKIGTLKESFSYAYESLERQRYEINIITNHFRLLGEQIPKSLRISLDELNKGLNDLTSKFQQEYENLMYRYSDNLQQNQTQNQNFNQHSNYQEIPNQ
jgi:hypothetical protein